MAGGAAVAGELSVHGFGTVGVAYLDIPDDWAYTGWLGQRASEEPVRADLDSMIGVQLNYGIGDELEFVAQGTAARRSQNADAEDYLGLAFMAWRPTRNWTLRLGRVNLDAYMISDHRDVGYTYQFIRPPQEFYARMPTSLDGGDITRSWVRGDAQWRAKLYTGTTTAGNDALSFWPMYGAMLSRESDGLLMRVSAVHARTSRVSEEVDPLVAGLRQLQQLPVPDIAAEAARFEQSLMARGVRTSYLAAAIAYDRDVWVLSAEVNRADSQAEPYSFSTGYVSIGRRFGALTAFVMGSAAIRDEDAMQAPDWGSALEPMDPALAMQAQALANGATRALNTASGDQFTTSAGLRWEVAPRVALKAQWDHVRTRREGDGIWHTSDGRASRSNILAIAADFVF